MMGRTHALTGALAGLFRTGKGVENYLVFPVVAAGCVLALLDVAVPLADLAGVAA